MELIERAPFLAALQAKFEGIAGGEGHCVLVSGEAGIGKTSLVRAFCRERRDDCKIYQGSCDALFTPRPLAPLHDIAWQMRSDLWENSGNMADKAGLFTKIFQELAQQKEPVIIVFEDIHWADEATLDFIKFFARRITQVHCLFVLTYRDDEIHPGHPLRNILGQLPPSSFTRVQPTPLSRQAVEKLSEQKGYSGEDVYSISGGNPFYVTEILASYSHGVPDNIKDSILSVYNNHDEKTQRVWRLLSVVPAGFEIKFLEKMDPMHMIAIENCIIARIAIVKDGYIYFKHELYRRTVEGALSPLVRVSLNKDILDLFRENFEQKGEIERIIHHAKNANEYDLVVHYAPLAAKQAACLGAHAEASKLYYTAIEYYQGKDKDLLIGLYEAYAYECYLTNRIKEAIIFQTKALNIWKEINDIEKIGNCLRFLSRLWWFDGNRKQAEAYGSKAVEILADKPSSGSKAMAFSNMSQLKMVSDELDECISWGEKAMAIAKEAGDEESLSHALNNVGSALMKISGSEDKGILLLQQSLDIALTHSYHEHAARAYTNLGGKSLEVKGYAFAKQILKEGVQYCEGRDLDFWKNYMLFRMARLELEACYWKEAYEIAEELIRNENQAPIVKTGSLVIYGTIKMRKGEGDALGILQEARAIAFEALELQRIIPALTALLEYEWLTGDTVVEQLDIDTTIRLIGQMGTVMDNHEFAFWLFRARKQKAPLRAVFVGYQVDSPAMVRTAAALWEKMSCPYTQAQILFEGTEEDKKEAISIVHQLGAGAVYEKMKQEMKLSGIKSIPRGLRKTTQSNSALLTERELGVLQLLKEGMQNKEIAAKLFISAKTVDHHISAILFKLDVNSRVKAVQEAMQLNIIK